MKYWVQLIVSLEWIQKDFTSFSCSSHLSVVLIIYKNCFLSFILFFALKPIYTVETFSATTENYCIWDFHSNFDLWLKSRVEIVPLSYGGKLFVVNYIIANWTIAMKSYPFYNHMCKYIGFILGYLYLDKNLKNLENYNIFNANKELFIYYITLHRWG